MNNSKNEVEEKIIKILTFLIDNITPTEIKTLNEYPSKVRKLYKHLKQNSNFIRPFSNSTNSMFTLNTKWEEINSLMTEWSNLLLSYIKTHLLESDEIDPVIYSYILIGIIIIRNIFPFQPLEKIKVSSDMNRFYLYQLLSYSIVTENIDIIYDNFDNLITLTKTNPTLAHKFYVILQQIILSRSISTEKEKKEVLDCFSLCKEGLMIEANTTNEKEETANNLGFFKKLLQFTVYPKFSNQELDGSNVNGNLTVMNICESYQSSFYQSSVVFSLSFQMLNKVNILEANSTIVSNAIFADYNLLLYSYCTRIFEQSENYLESKKNKTIQDTKNLNYNLNLIEGAVLEGLKIINLLCKFQPSLISLVDIKIKQIYERIASKQSGICIIEILQFYIDNLNSIIINLDSYLSEFFREKLSKNIKNEILAYYTMEFLYKNKEIINEQTNVFVTYFPIITKLFCLFPDFINTKYFELIEYIVHQETFSEMLNYFLDLPSAILIYDNFSNFIPSKDGQISDMFSPEYKNLVEILLRDVSLEKNYQCKVDYSSNYNQQIDFLFKQLVFTSRVLSVTKIVPKLIALFFQVIMKRDEIYGAYELTQLILKRFCSFNANENFKKTIRELLIKTLEQLFNKWPQIVGGLRDSFLQEIKENFNNIVKRDLISCLLWSLGEFFSFNDEEMSDTEEYGILQKIFDSLETILKENIEKFAKQDDEEVFDKAKATAKEMINYYSSYYNDKITEEEISDERIIIVLITTLGKLSFKFTLFRGRILKCFSEIKEKIRNETIISTLNEMIVSSSNISLITEYII